MTNDTNVRDTVIVNGYDLIWKDPDIPLNAPHPFFFKHNPIQYLIGLVQKNWAIILYYHQFLYDEARTYPNINRTIDIITARQRAIDDQVRYFGHIIYLTDDDLSINDRINLNSFSDASFTIALDKRETHQTHTVELPGNKLRQIVRYDPIEIFGLVNPYHIPDNVSPGPNVQYFIITNSRARQREFIQQYNAIPLSRNRIQRQNDIQVFHQNNPEIQIIEIWSPIYQYNHDVQEDYIVEAYPFDSPYQDNFVIGVTYYIQGY